jgi:hypothetical protein
MGREIFGKTNNKSITVDYVLPEGCLKKMRAIDCGKAN